MKARSKYGLNNINIMSSTISVTITKESKISSKNDPCVEDPNYDYYKCFESYFYKRRECQYPWNVYPDLKVPSCNNFTRTERMVLSKDRNFGKNRIYFDHSERLSRTKMECSRPCKFTVYKLRYGVVDFGDRLKGFQENSIQIGFPNFRIVEKNEYPACDLSCVIGRLGGNLGFFLGGSILAGVDFVVNILSNLISRIVQKHVNLT